MDKSDVSPQVLDAEALQADGLDLDIVQQMKDMALKDTMATLADPDIVQKLSAQFEVNYASTKVSAGTAVCVGGLVGERVGGWEGWWVGGLVGGWEGWWVAVL